MNISTLKHERRPLLTASLFAHCGEGLFLLTAFISSRVLDYFNAKLHYTPDIAGSPTVIYDGHI